MNATQYVVPAVLRGAMFVPRQAPGRREPARVTPGAFKSLAGKRFWQADFGSFVEVAGSFASAAA